MPAISHATHCTLMMWYCRLFDIDVGYSITTPAALTLNGWWGAGDDDKFRGVRRWVKFPIDESPVAFDADYKHTIHVLEIDTISARRSASISRSRPSHIKLSWLILFSIFVSMLRFITGRPKFDLLWALLTLIMKCHWQLAEFLEAACLLFTVKSHVYDRGFSIT